MLTDEEDETSSLAETGQSGNEEEKEPSGQLKALNISGSETVFTKIYFSCN